MASTKASSPQEGSEHMAEVIDRWLDNRAIRRPQGYVLMRGQYVIATCAVIDTSDAPKKEFHA